MSKKVIYHISGFDCPNCAAKVERFLNKEEYIQSATIDFTNERMYINYREEPLSTEQLIEVIKTVESDPLRIEKIQQGRKAKHSLFDKKMIFNLSRIVIATILLFVSRFVFAESNFLVSAIFAWCFLISACLAISEDNSLISSFFNVSHASTSWRGVVGILSATISDASSCGRFSKRF